MADDIPGIDVSQEAFTQRLLMAIGAGATEAVKKALKQVSKRRKHDDARDAREQKKKKRPKRDKAARVALQTLDFIDSIDKAERRRGKHRRERRRERRENKLPKPRRCPTCRDFKPSSRQWVINGDIVECLCCARLRRIVVEVMERD